MHKFTITSGPLSMWLLGPNILENNWFGMEIELRNRTEETLLHNICVGKTIISGLFVPSIHNSSRYIFFKFRYGKGVWVPLYCDKL